MNASDIVKAKQNRVLFQAYYHPIATTSTISTISYTSSLVSSISTGGAIYDDYLICSTVSYQNLCFPPVITYQLANNINEGKYLCRQYNLAELQGRNIVETSTAVTSCFIPSELAWKNVNSTMVYEYDPIYAFDSTLQSVDVTSTVIATGPLPIVCPLISFYQGTNFSSQCKTCNQAGGCNC